MKLDSGGSGRLVALDRLTACRPDAGGGIAVVRRGPRSVASTADDGLTGIPGGDRSVSSTPEDSARDGSRTRGVRGDTGVDPGSGGTDRAATTVAPTETEQQSSDQ